MLPETMLGDPSGPAILASHRRLSKAESAPCDVFGRQGVVQISNNISCFLYRCQILVVAQRQRPVSKGEDLGAEAFRHEFPYVNIHFCDFADIACVWK